MQGIFREFHNERFNGLLSQSGLLRTGMYVETEID
jgi:hypothetical protein